MKRKQTEPAAEANNFNWIVLELLELFGARDVTVRGDNSEMAARQLAADQAKIYDKIMRVAYAAAEGAAKDGRKVGWPIRLDNIIKRALNDHPPAVLEAGSDHIVRGIGPPVLAVEAPKSLEAIAARVGPEIATDFLDAVCAVIIRGTKRALVEDVVQQTGAGSIRFLTALNRIEAVASTMVDAENAQTAVELVSQSARSEFDARVLAFQTELAELSAKARTEFETVERLRLSGADVAEGLAAAKRDIQAVSDEVIRDLAAAKADLEDKYAGSASKASAFLDSIRAQTNFDALKIHWNDRSRDAKRAFIISSVVLLALLVIVPGFAIYEKDVVISFMKGLAGAATVDVGIESGPVGITVATISRLVIITIPLALYFWLIRLVVRFNLRSMLLMDDAGQRATMLETYYRMIEKEAALVGDRALVLQALMRPAPGHGGDTIDPPNFTEVIDKAMGK